ncbi:hypothetical protein SAMN05421810_101709 [Amycolatopsis arida]|uniref:Uncharacterized protein n=1 Tax=Amycolatopsis arida TaxID=587909 RepID=A0A1I5LX17_9PSEU|nr:hypothetical protein [Amycolatopsis arida]TDX93885.1 hypothetical protein CLV69_104342 [Amycolatopsis arida]SFP01908.1 hypothetical protein SAMN05421810_101709 [Amycolatopsis arida]
MPLVGTALAIVRNRMGEVWITVAMTLTAVAGGALITQIHSWRRRALSDPDGGRELRTLAALTGVHDLPWTAVVVLMIVRPGSPE